MKIVIVADIHGNHDALSALPEDYDELWVLGDLVNYGPQPREVVNRVMQTASLVIQGNHDYAVAHDDDSQWTAQYREMAAATRAYTSGVLAGGQKRYLRDLPRQAQATRDGHRFHLVHAMPSNPFYGHCAPDGEGWVTDMSTLSADILLVGHSHRPFIRKIGDRTLVNPGSIGQPRTGTPHASYAVWQDGGIQLKSFSYPVGITIARLQALPLDSTIKARLTGILGAGSV
ncbi:metallophosphoesterase family protein [Insolitispirillum peregrinum]|uniref:metallophosphoesterase family protein n=1 Tax=Insolitispirillum peregrinum TaxID=80876 RepID=UPI0036124A1A